MVAWIILQPKWLNYQTLLSQSCRLCPDFIKRLVVTTLISSYLIVYRELPLFEVVSFAFRWRRNIDLICKLNTLTRAGGVRLLGESKSLSDFFLKSKRKKYYKISESESLLWILSWRKKKYNYISEPRCPNSKTGRTIKSKLVLEAAKGLSSNANRRQ